MTISIYPVAGGEARELRAEAGIAASGPFDSPEAIAGRLAAVPAADELAELRSSDVLFEGETYRFTQLGRDGAFELRKAW